MLVLARKVGEKVRIGDNIEVVVIEVRGDLVRLGISAPRGISIHREEVYAAIQSENIAALTVQGDIAQMKKLFQTKGGE